jgi:hypothetical protein
MKAALTHALAAGMVICAGSFHSALADDWRYCLAPSYADHRVYITVPFRTTASLDDVETSFHKHLIRIGLSHDIVQCPRGAAEEVVLARRRHSVVFNRQSNNDVINIDWKR